MKLYKITCRGMGSWWYESYAIARDSETAYRLVREHLDAKGVGTDEDREMKRIELLAEDYDYPSCQIRLYMQESK